MTGNSAKPPPHEGYKEPSLLHAWVIRNWLLSLAVLAVLGFGFWLLYPWYFPFVFDLIFGRQIAQVDGYEAMYASLHVLAEALIFIVALFAFIHQKNDFREQLKGQRELFDERVRQYEVQLAMHRKEVAQQSMQVCFFSLLSQFRQFVESIKYGSLSGRDFLLSWQRARWPPGQKGASRFREET